MGFYHPSTIVKDAQRHGLKVLPVDVSVSEWLCTVEPISHRRHGDTENLLNFDFRLLTQEKLHAGQSQNAKGKRRNCPNGQRSTANGLATDDPRPKTDDLALRLGLCYARGVREEGDHALVSARAQQPFASIDDLVRRVPELRRNELITLAEIGALNAVPTSEFRVSSNSEPGTRNSKLSVHRRSALWQVERATRPVGPLLSSEEEHGVFAEENCSPLAAMTREERLIADFHGTGLTTGPHPMAYCRNQMRSMGVLSAAELQQARHGRHVRAAGCVICRQRPGTAKGFVFLSLEDETGIANAIVMPDLFDQYRFELVSEKFLVVEGMLQNQDGVVSVKAERIAPLHVTAAETTSHDFH
jgi:error-prone DNA polymerase